MMGSGFLVLPSWFIKTVNSVYPEFIMIHSFAFIYICQQLEKTGSATTGTAMGSGLNSRATARTAMCGGLNSNSTSTVQDPLENDQNSTQNCHGPKGCLECLVVVRYSHYFCTKRPLSFVRSTEN